VRLLTAAIAWLIAVQHVTAQDAGDLPARPAVLMQRAYVDYVFVRACRERQTNTNRFVSSDDFISSDEMRRARADISSIEGTIKQLDPSLDYETLWKQAVRSRESRKSADAFAALMMLGLKSYNERCRYYFDDLEKLLDTVPHLGREKDF
jgi:hypothetical protein